MRTLARTFSALALVVAATLIPTAAGSAKPHPKTSPAAWAKKHHLRRNWRAKDADRDGLTSLREFKLKTDPRRPDSDRDGLKDGDEVRVGDNPLKADTDGDQVKDGAEGAGVIAAYDGGSIAVRLFHGGLLKAEVAEEADCSVAGEVADDAGAGEPGPGDDAAGDEDFVDDGGEDVAEAAMQEIDLTDDSETADDASAGDEEDVPSCDDPRLKRGALVRSVEVERDGGTLVAVAIELAPKS